MPLIKLTLPEPEKNTVEIQQKVSKVVAAVTGKPESAVMVTTDKADFLMNREKVTGAFVEIRGIGKIEPETNAEISRQISAILVDDLGIIPECIYLNFMDFARSNWGNAKGTY